MIKLEEITADNLEDVLKLKVLKNQENFVSTTAYSLAQAYVYQENAYPFAIYADDTLVGFMMFGFYESRNQYTLMNAKAVHNYFEDNRKAAINLHLKAGFIQTGHKNGIVDFLITKEQYKRLKVNFCYCGHDCSKCVTYIATQRNDDNLRRQSQSFYKENFDLDIPLEKFNCNGGRSDKVFEPCKECPFIKCCKRHDVNSCSKCPEYPCKNILDYQAKYVNKCNQI